MDPETLGWDSYFDDSFQSVAPPGAVPGRVVREDRERYAVLTEEGERQGEVTGAFRHAHERLEEFPSVGDWVVAEPVPGEAKARILEVLPRRTAFKRTVAGRTSDVQVVAANVDVVFLVSGLDHDANPRRIERYLTLAFESGARPVIVLNKADLADAIDDRIREIAGVAMDIPIETVSATEGDGIDRIRGYVQTGKTAAFLGSSGVGKSTLINALAGDTVMATGAVREDDSRGRHTTTHRELIVLPTGGLLIDTPGMREIQMTGATESAQDAFSDIEALAETCRFRNCGHNGEAGCAIAEALESGELDARRYESYLKLQRELAYNERRASESKHYEERRHAKKLNKLYKRVQQEKRSQR